MPVCDEVANRCSDDHRFVITAACELGQLLTDMVFEHVRSRSHFGCNSTQLVVELLLREVPLRDRRVNCLPQSLRCRVDQQDTHPSRISLHEQGRDRFDPNSLEPFRDPLDARAQRSDG